MILKFGYQSVSIQFYVACDTKNKISHMYTIYPEKAIREVKLGCFDTVFQTPYQYFSVDVKVILYPRKIVIKSLSLTDFGLNFVKIDNRYCHENHKQKSLETSFG